MGVGRPPRLAPAEGVLNPEREAKNGYGEAYGDVLVELAVPRIAPTDAGEPALGHMASIEAAVAAVGVRLLL
jgi:hypothetical protein